MTLRIKTKAKRQVIDITNEVERLLKPGQSGLVNVFVKHTTAAVTTADLDPGTDLDFLDFLQSLIPEIEWRHLHNPAHVPDHLLSSLIGPGVSVPVINGGLELGSWQRIILVEFDGPRERQIEVLFLASATS